MCEKTTTANNICLNKGYRLYNAYYKHYSAELQYIATVLVSYFCIVIMCYSFVGFNSKILMIR